MEETEPLEMEEAEHDEMEEEEYDELEDAAYEAEPEGCDEADDGEVAPRKMYMSAPWRGGPTVKKKSPAQLRRDDQRRRILDSYHKKPRWD
jgi:hypothetical protein